jgi:hypothetical protein
MMRSPTTTLAIIENLGSSPISTNEQFLVLGIMLGAFVMMMIWFLVSGLGK